MKTLLIITIFLVSLNSMAASLKILASGISTTAKIDRTSYFIRNNNAEVFIGGKTTVNKRISCNIKFPIYLQEHALNLYKTMFNNINTNNFILKCKNNNLPSSNYVVVEVNNDTQNGEYSLTKVK